MLELFSGSGNMAAAFKAAGWQTCTVDLHKDADIQADVRSIDPAMILDHLGGYPDVIWASPPCTQFSIASVGHHWKGHKPPKDGTELLAHTLRLIMQLQPRYYFVENPRGMMRKLKIMEHLPRRTLTFCQYGDNAQKPTDVWTNHRLFYPKMCKRGADCHDRSPRGWKKGGTQGKKDAASRGALPPEFCRIVAESC
jgi:hypothetical protein